ncbi:hypothetical protein PsorP6_009378 [Peronosclerospora sorghi]|uniref:Uncharacterized protein n=1 Tax=Peronosclerospora sorghi TaxID=230839 RepID=A0ACC0VZD6_9STRA|nr:hypothetical protein PsorP6_009378 [Peronosclerospora sorghi]
MEGSRAQCSRLALHPGVSPAAPPKGLDDDEYEYIKELESKKDAFERKRQAQHKEDLAQFLVARGAPKSTVSGHLTAQQLQQHPPKGELKTTSKAQSAMVMVKAKQKAQDRKTRDPDLGAAASADKVIERPQKKKQKVEKASTSVGGEREKATTAALGLVSYDSDSDSNSSDGAAAAS